MQFGGLTALSNVSVSVPRGRDPRRHRPQRRGQVDLLQLPDRRAPPDRGPHHLRRRGHHRIAARSHLSQGHRPLVPDHQHPARGDGAGERAHRRPVSPPRLESSASPPRLRRRGRAGPGGAGGGEPPRQGRRAGSQPLPRRAAQPRDRHRAGHRAQAALPRRADRRHERGRDAPDGGADQAHRAQTSPS